MSSTAIAWDELPTKLDADPAATVSLDRAAWERVGASFQEMDDGEGETPGLATATAEIDHDPVRIGVVDYGESSTYLLVPGRDQERLARTLSVLKTLEEEGALRMQTDLLDLADVAPPPTLEDRVAELERRLAEISSESVGEKAIPLQAGVDLPGGFGLVEVKTHFEQQVIESFAPTSAEQAHTGVVKWFNVDKGYGLIEPDRGEREFFISFYYVSVPYRALPQGLVVNLETLNRYGYNVLDFGVSGRPGGAGLPPVSRRGLVKDS